MGDALVVDEHAIGNGIVVTDDGVDEFVDEGIGIEAEGLHREGHHLREKGGAGHVGVLGQPRLEAARDAAGLWHSAEAGGMLHHTLALGDRELAEKEVAFARSGGDPVGVSAAGVEKGRLRRP